MRQFNYTYQGQTWDALVCRSAADLDHQYSIIIDSKIIDISPRAARALGGKTIWVQADKSISPKSLIQAIGEGLEASGIYPDLEKS